MIIFRKICLKLFFMAFLLERVYCAILTEDEIEEASSTQDKDMNVYTACIYELYEFFQWDLDKDPPSPSALAKTMFLKLKRRSHKKSDKPYLMDYFERTYDIIDTNSTALNVVDWCVGEAKGMEGIKTACEKRLKKFVKNADDASEILRYIYYKFVIDDFPVKGDFARQYFFHLSLNIDHKNTVSDFQSPSDFCEEVSQNVPTTNPEESDESDESEESEESEDEFAGNPSGVGYGYGSGSGSGSGFAYSYASGSGSRSGAGYGSGTTGSGSWSFGFGYGGGGGGGGGGGRGGNSNA